MDSKEVRILLVDDEPALTKLMQTYLTRIGYTVDTSLNAAGAFALVKQAKAPYHLLVSDLTLPDMQGDDMALQMLKSNPLLRVLVCSGYPFAVDSLPENVQHRFTALLKPFLPNMLAKEIEELLQRHLD